MFVDRGDMRKSAHTSSGLQEVNGWSLEKQIRAAVRKSLQPNLIKAVVCVPHLPANTGVQESKFQVEYLLACDMKRKCRGG